MKVRGHRCCMVDASRTTDLIFVGCIFFSWRRCLRPWLCGSDIGLCGSTEPSQDGSLTVYLVSPFFYIILQDAQEQVSSSWSAHLQTCKCSCASSGYFGRFFTALLMVANQALSCAQLPVFAGATWPCAWLLPCMGSAPRRRPFRLQKRWGQPSMVGALACHATPVLSECSATWSGGFRHVRRCVTRALLLFWASSLVRGCRVRE